MNAPARLCLRIDDIGASTKRHAVYSNKLRGAGNWLFLKYLPGLRAWGRYREMEAEEWETVFSLLRKFRAKLTVGITACWVEYDGTLVPFPEKHPGEAAKLREGMREGLLEIANHGLTHCIVDGLKFRPRAFASNRSFHREFWGYLPPEHHIRNLERSQAILQGYFGAPITSFIPPGNVFSDATVSACRAVGITRINCQTQRRALPGFEIHGNEGVLAFHDRELVLQGPGWLANRLARQPPGTEYLFVRDLDGRGAHGG